MPGPIIFHVDMDAFFVSVEELFDPTLKGKPVVVGGRAQDRGVVSAASYAARAFGVHSAMPLRTAHKLCPQAIFVEGHPDRYRDYSLRVRAIFDRFTPLVEMASIDEAYLDLTGAERLHGPPLKCAHALHHAILRETGLNSSIGIARTRLVAKISSDQAKPNGVLWVLPGAEARFLAPLEVRRIPGVGKASEARLHALGIRRVGDLGALDSAQLEKRFGKWGLALAGKARGEDSGAWFETPVGRRSGPKSISHEHTFSTDTADPALLDATLLKLSEMVARRLRRHNLRAGVIQVKLRDSAFITQLRSRSLAAPTDLDLIIARQAHALFHENWRVGGLIRLIGICASELEPETGQLPLAPESPESRWYAMMRTADRLRDRFGDSAVTLAGGLGGAFRERTHDALPQNPQTDGKKPHP